METNRTQAQNEDLILDPATRRAVVHQRTKHGCSITDVATCLGVPAWVVTAIDKELCPDVKRKNHAWVRNAKAARL